MLQIIRNIINKYFKLAKKFLRFNSKPNGNLISFSAIFSNYIRFLTSSV